MLPLAPQSHLVPFLCLPELVRLAELVIVARYRSVTPLQSAGMSQASVAVKRQEVWRRQGSGWKPMQTVIAAKIIWLVHCSAAKQLGGLLVRQGR